MNDRSDEGGVAVAVENVWHQLQPALEQHYTARSAAVRPMERRPGRRRTRRAVGLGLALVVVGTGGAVAARALLGDPAPPSVQASLAAVDEGMPADLRLQPDVANARSVARDGDAVLYAADRALATSGWRRRSAGMPSSTAARLACTPAGAGSPRSARAATAPPVPTTTSASPRPTARRVRSRPGRRSIGRTAALRAV